MKEISEDVTKLAEPALPNVVVVPIPNIEPPTPPPANTMTQTPTVTVTTTSPPQNSPSLPTQTITEVYTADTDGATDEAWYKRIWRPSMAFLYMAICAFDFIIAPAVMMIVLPILKMPYSPWIPLTLQNGGLVHFSFGAILGIYSWGRNQLHQSVGA